MTKHLCNLVHDFRCFLWGRLTNHPSWRETRLGWVWPIEVHRCNSVYGYSFQVWLSWPQVHILNAFDLEADYMNRGGVNV